MNESQKYYNSLLPKETQKYSSDKKIDGIDELFEETNKETDFALTTSLPQVEINNITDPMENTGEISSIELEKLKELKEVLEKTTKIEQEEINKNQSQGQEKGRQYVKRDPKTSKFTRATDSEENNKDTVWNGFINTFVIALVTALIGTGWLIYIINQIG